MWGLWSESRVEWFILTTGEVMHSKHKSVIIAAREHYNKLADGDWEARRIDIWADELAGEKNQIITNYPSVKC